MSLVFIVVLVMDCWVFAGILEWIVTILGGFWLLTFTGYLWSVVSYQADFNHGVKTNSADRVPEEGVDDDERQALLNRRVDGVEPWGWA